MEQLSCRKRCTLDRCLAISRLQLGSIRLALHRSALNSLSSSFFARLCTHSLLNPGAKFYPCIQTSRHTRNTPILQNASNSASSSCRFSECNGGGFVASKKFSIVRGLTPVGRPPRLLLFARSPPAVIGTG